MGRGMMNCTLPLLMACIPVVNICTESACLGESSRASAFSRPCITRNPLVAMCASQCALYPWASPPGKMLVVDEEAVQVLQVTAGGAKKAAKLLVKRACMGTRPTAHSFHAPVLAMPHIVSYRPGLFCIGFVGVL
jgi:hypothetical protein